MKKLKVLCALFFSTSVFATSVINLSIEPVKAIEPRKAGKSYLYGKDREWQCIFNGQYGWMLSENLVVGPSVGFSWNIEKERSRVSPANAIDDSLKTELETDKIISKERMIMLPISLFLLIDPAPQFMVHPTAHFSLGYNQAVISNVFYNKEESRRQDAAKEYDGYYSGLYVKFGFDCMIDIGKQISIFAGPQWQISTMERRGKDKLNGYDERYEYKFNAFGLRIGVSALL